MKYFTPQLYQQFNSPDEAEAARASEAWDEAILAYNRGLEAIKPQMSDSVRQLSELCLHDAEILAREDKDSDLHLWPFGAMILTLQQEDEIISLFYALRDDVCTMQAPLSWRFSKVRPHWLYDEVHVSQQSRVPRYTHHILLSTGEVLLVPFVSVLIHRARLVQAARVPMVEME